MNLLYQGRHAILASTETVPCGGSEKSNDVSEFNSKKGWSGYGAITKGTHYRNEIKGTKVQNWTVHALAHKDNKQYRCSKKC